MQQCPGDVIFGNIFALAKAPEQMWLQLIITSPHKSSYTCKSTFFCWQDLHLH